jgi:hypothetical protein
MFRKLTCGLITTAALGTVALAPGAAIATPYFANQTGLDCLSCHNNAPTGRSAADDLTAAGRRFKAGGFDPSAFSKPVSRPVCHRELRPDGVTSFRVCGN